jgi:hypothetical protein
MFEVREQDRHINKMASDSVRIRNGENETKDSANTQLISHTTTCLVSRSYCVTHTIYHTKTKLNSSFCPCSAFVTHRIVRITVATSLKSIKLTELCSLISAFVRNRQNSDISFKNFRFQSIKCI